MINQRLFDHYGIDTAKDLRAINRCMRPFDTVLIDKRGSCYACECQSWLPQSIGNLQIMTMAEILKSNNRRALQSSIEDGTYRFCNEHQCTYLREGGPNDTKELEQGPERVFQLRLAIDESCNLRCPSCRKGLVFHKQGREFDLAIGLADKINKWLKGVKHPVTIHMGSDGDPFASHVYRHFMSTTPMRDDFRYSILTNGLMFDEFHSKIPHIMTNLTELGVSIDGATKETYEALRLGGNWEKINQGLDSVRRAKETHGFKFTLHFVIQQGNYHEMEKIIELGKQYQADKVVLSKVEDWNVLSDFKSIDIFDPSHEQHRDYLNMHDRVKVNAKDRGYGIMVETV